MKKLALEIAKKIVYSNKAERCKSRDALTHQRPINCNVAIIVAK